MTKEKELSEKRKEFVPSAAYNVTPIIASSASGCKLTGMDGEEYIDFATGIGCLNIGHTHERVVEKVKEQVDKYSHLCWHVTMDETYINLAEKLSEKAIQGPAETLLVNSGAEAVENAIKVTRHYTGNSGIITFENAFHGRTNMALALTSKVDPYKKGFGPFPSEVIRAPYAYCYRCPVNEEYPECDLACLNFFDKLFKEYISEDETGSLIVEPIQGEGGFIVPPDGYLKELEKICNERDIPMIVDEIQSGMGRTGDLFAFEHDDLNPDVVTIGKSLGGGFPLTATVGREEIMESPQKGGLGGTFGGNPVGCVAALEAIEIVEENLDRAQDLGEILTERLNELKESHEIIGDIRGRGLMQAVELVKDREKKTPAPEERDQILAELHSKGLILLGAGTFNNVIRFLPPLTISEEKLKEGLDIFESALK
ncbi:4-aminobutyrate aminotransferase [candidate division MSBL1 archaeon SCGC-AAA382A03]|uniref:Ornithine aminotransferase n=1 Tax=candidate division MSBL1 archaeon SCGC-AAA382A03 TaxID=1698278 RepID=A0A133VGT5_9EURY|nr:4-aminobutyrate aminotransferase [candidate division MSBL1 archaeon SCGC-AAA382A03]